jgi:hypothetical protein
VHELLSIHAGPQFILLVLTLELSSSPTPRDASDPRQARLKRSHPRIRRMFVRVRKPDRPED